MNVATKLTVIPDIAESDTDLASRFTREVGPLFDVLLRGARRLTRSEADAEDLLQDTLLHAYRGFRSFRPGTNLQAWLFRILQNQWVNNYHYKQRRPAEVSVDIATDRDLESSASRLPAGLRSAEDEALDAFPDDRFKVPLDSLPDGFRMAVFYIDVQGYAYAEAAAALKIPLGTLMSRLARGRQRLRIDLVDIAGNRSHVASVERRIA